jgi:hypothetical protein
VASSSPSFRVIRDTSTWAGARLVMGPGRRARRRLMAGAAAVFLLLAVGLVGLAAGWFRPSPPVTSNPGTAPADAGKPAPSPREDLANAAPPADPNVLTVSQKPEGGGAYRTVAAALEAVKPGQTIRVLDDGVYREIVRITGRTERAGVTLEAVAGATLEMTGMDRSFVLEVAAVPDVTVRGFRLRARKTTRSALVVVRGRCPGLRLEDLEFKAEESPGTNGLELLAAAGSAPDQAPVVVRRSAFQHLQLGAILSGIQGGTTVCRTAVRDCLFVDCRGGVTLQGRAREVQLVGNRFRGVSMAAMQLEFLSEDTEGILIANNTVCEGAAAWRLWDRAVNGRGVQVRNNLVLGGEDLDMLVLDAVDAQEHRGPGNGTAVARAYQFSHSWREGREPAGQDVKGCVPPDPMNGDVLTEKIDGVNRDPRSPDFLRPDKDSPLATEGAGKDDPTLPRYVGAVPPEGAEAWDWDRTWPALTKSAGDKK